MITTVSKEKEYRKELEHQLEESFRVKNIFTRLRKTYRRTFFDKWVAGGMMLLAESVFYLLFIAYSLITLMVFIDQPFTNTLTEYIANDFQITMQDSATAIMIGKVALILFSAFLLCVGLILRGIRIRNAVIDNLISEINSDIRSEEEREDSIKKVL